MMDNVITDLIDSYRSTGELDRLCFPILPSMDRIALFNERIKGIIFPGNAAVNRMQADTIQACLEEHILELYSILQPEIARAFANHDGGASAHDAKSEELTWELLRRLPDIRRRIVLDAQAIYRGDPAAKSDIEVIIAYPGLEAIMIHRTAHELLKLGVPLVPRMMNEHIHGKTGVDIHPAATIGDHFFIDHATGVVIGETTIIGSNVKVYQGVTLGALRILKSQSNIKRHPTIEDDVTIYSGATILGGETLVGRGSTIGGNVWLTHSVPPNSTVYNEARTTTKSKHPATNDSR